MFIVFVRVTFKNVEHAVEFFMKNTYQAKKWKKVVIIDEVYLSYYKKKDQFIIKKVGFKE